jgi:hypothetical protein
MATVELTPAQRKIKKEVGKLERRIKRTNETQAARKKQVETLRSRLK